MSAHRQKATIDGNSERWHDAPVGHVVAGPCPRCLRNGKTLNCCTHQLPHALGYVIATFEIVDGDVKESA